MGALGHFQFMPDTRNQIYSQCGHDPFSPVPEVAAQAAGFYLSQLKDQFHGDVGMALAAYNAGGGRVQKAIKKAKDHGGSWLDAMPKETRNYVPSIMARFGQQISDSWNYVPEEHTEAENTVEVEKRKTVLQGIGVPDDYVKSMKPQELLGMMFFSLVVSIIGKIAEGQGMPAPALEGDPEKTEPAASKANYPSVDLGPRRSFTAAPYTPPGSPAQARQPVLAY